jgi:hypothetical protein
MLGACGSSHGSGQTARQPQHASTTSARAVIIGSGTAAAGQHLSVTVERSSNSADSECSVYVAVSVGYTNRGSESSTGATNECLSPSHYRPEQSVNCAAGLLTIQAHTLPQAHMVRLVMSDGREIASPAWTVPANLGGPIGVYYQVVRGPSPIPVSLRELDSQGRTIGVLKLPPVVECTANPLKYLPGGIVRLVHSRVPHGPAFSIVGERYRFLGHVYVQAKAELSGGEGGSSGGMLWSQGGVNAPGEGQLFMSQSSEGCEPHPFELVYGLLRNPTDTVLLESAGHLIALPKVAIPRQLHTAGVLVYGAFSTLPSELIVRNARGKTLYSEDRRQLAKLELQQCERGASGALHAFRGSAAVHTSP